MSEEVNNLILEHLRHIRGRVDQISEDMKDVKLRLSAVENGLSLVRREVVLGDEADCRQQVSIDRLVERIERIERRLDIQDET